MCMWLNEIIEDTQQFFFTPEGKVLCRSQNKEKEGSSENKPMARSEV